MSAREREGETLQNSDIKMSEKMMRERRETKGFVCFVFLSERMGEKGKETQHIGQLMEEGLIHESDDYDAALKIIITITIITVFVI